jgi:dTDP-4-dehydrorhamnose reductase
MKGTVPVYPITTAEAGRAAPRPPYSVLANRVLAEAGITLPHWKEALTRYMSEQKKVEVEAKAGSA